MPLPTIPSGNVASATASTSFDIDYSCRFNGADSAYMSKTPSSNGSQTISTFSAWIKKAINGSYEGVFTSVYETGEYFEINFEPSDKLEIRSKYSSSYVLSKQTTRVFRDPAAWYHICVILDTTDGTAEDRCKVFINGVRETSFSTNTNPGSSQNLGLNATSYEHRVGRDEWSTPAYFDGYMAEVHWIDGTAKAVTDFGEFDSTSPSIWKPKAYTGGGYGTNGFYLDFADSGNLGDDESGNTLDLAESNIVAADQMIDTPTNNFPTFNPIVTAGASDGSVYTMGYKEGNLQGATQGAQGPLTQIIPNQGKWFCELHFNHATADSDPGTIIATLTSLQNYHWYQSGHIGIVFKWHGDIYENGSDSGTNSDAYTTGDIISLAINRDDNQITLYKNGSVMTNANARSFSNLGNYDDFVIAYQDGANSSTYDTLCDLNAGQNGTFNGRKTAGGNADGNGYGNFSMAVPTGYYSLCSKNIAEFG